MRGNHLEIKQRASTGSGRCLAVFTISHRKGSSVQTQRGRFSVHPDPCSRLLQFAGRPQSTAGCRRARSGHAASQRSRMTARAQIALVGGAAAARRRRAVGIQMGAVGAGAAPLGQPPLPGTPATGRLHPARCVAHRREGANETKTMSGNDR